MYTRTKNINDKIESAYIRYEGKIKLYNSVYEVSEISSRALRHAEPDGEFS